MNTKVEYLEKPADRKRSDAPNPASYCPRSPMALIVDITCTTPHYDAALANALADYPDVEFRTSPFFQDATVFKDSSIKQDLLPVLGRLVHLCPGITRQRWLWKMLQLHGYLSGCFSL